MNIQFLYKYIIFKLQIFKFYAFSLSLSYMYFYVYIVYIYKKNIYKTSFSKKQILFETILTSSEIISRNL